MTVRPMSVLSLKHLRGLGFQIKKVKKDFRIQLDQKDKDWRCKLILAYYSMNLVQAFLLEGCLATLINTAMSKNKYSLGEPFELAPLMRIATTYADLF